MPLHVRDVVRTPEAGFAEVGTGVHDFPAILTAARTIGVQWSIFEQDDTYGRSPIAYLANQLWE